MSLFQVFIGKRTAKESLSGHADQLYIGRGGQVPHAVARHKECHDNKSANHTVCSLVLSPNLGKGSLSVHSALHVGARADFGHLTGAGVKR
jgi:hypothetical protein